MNSSLLSGLLFCLFLCGTALPGVAQAGQEPGGDPLAKLQKEGWKIVQDGVLRRELRANKVETFVFGEAGFAWKLQDLRAQLLALRSEFQTHPTPELRRAIASHRKIIASTLKMIERAQIAEANGEDTVLKAGCIPTFSYNAYASYKTDRQGTWADASADFNVSAGCDSFGEVYAYVFAKTTVNGAASTATVTDGPRSGSNVSAIADANRNGGAPCESYAYASVTSDSLNPTSYSLSVTNDRCPDPSSCKTLSRTAQEPTSSTQEPDGLNAPVGVTVTCVDDNPVAVADTATVNEDSGANAINVLANDTDVDGGPISITSVTQPANGTVFILGGGAALAYRPNANYCNNPPGTTLNTFTYTLTPGGSSTTVTVTVTCVNDPPVADNDTFDFIGNTDLVVDLAALPTPHALETTGSGLGVLDGDSDVEGDAFIVSGITVGACTDASIPLDCSDLAVGRVQMQPNGQFIFTPAPGDTGATETFQYTVTDNGMPAPASTIATVTLTRFERVWYVNNDAEPGGNGTSIAPFNAITTINLSDTAGDSDLTDDLDSAGDYIFVYFGDGTTTNQSGGLVLENGQHLIGQHAGLSLNVNLNGNGAPTNLVAASAGNRPLLDDNVADGFDGVSALDVIPAEIVGMNLAGNVNGIDWTTTGAFAGAGEFVIRDNVIRSASNEAVDINLAGTGSTRLAFHDNSLTASGTALDIQETGTGALTITRFDDNVVGGNTGSSGMVVSNAVFDSIPGGGLNTVDGGTTMIGAPGNGVGGAGMALGNVQGDLHFTGNLNIFADSGAGLTVSGTGAGMTLRVNSGGAPTGIVEATGGPAVNASAVTLDLRLTSLRSTNSASTGVSLTNVDGTFSAETGSSITSSAGTDFAISGGTANVTYKGTITDDVGQLVSVSGVTAGTKSFQGAITDGDDGDGSGVSLSGNTGATIRFSGGLVLSTGTNAAFAATGGGTLEVCDENPCNGAATGGLINKITTTTGMALNVANTNIGTGGLEFRSISAGNVASGPANGILLNNTGLSGSLKVNGTGSAASGGTIRNTTGDGISLNSTKTPSFRFLNVWNTGGHGISASNMTAGLTLTSCQILGAGNGDNEHGLKVTNVSGTIVVSGSTFSDAEENLIDIDNNNTNLILIVDAGAFSHGALGTFMASGVQLVGRGSTSYSVNVSNSQFTNVHLFAVNVNGDGASSGAHAITVDNNDFIVTTPGRTNAINLLALNTSDVTFSATNNEADGGGAIQVRADNGSVVKATISGNFIANTHDNGILAAVDKSARLRLLIDNNQIFNTSSDGMALTNFDLDGGVGSELDAIITGNTVNGHNNDSAGNAFLAGIRVRSRSGSTCVKLAGNDVQGTPFPGSYFDYSLRETGGTMILEEDPDTSATIVSADYVLDGGLPDIVDATPPNVGGSNTLDLVGTIDLSNGVVVCDRP